MSSTQDGTRAVSRTPISPSRTQTALYMNTISLFPSVVAVAVVGIVIDAPDVAVVAIVAVVVGVAVVALVAIGVVVGIVGVVGVIGVAWSVGLRLRRRRRSFVFR